MSDTINHEGMMARHSNTMMADLLDDKEGGARRLFGMLIPIRDRHIPNERIHSVIPMMNELLKLKDHKLLYALFALAVNEFNDLRRWMCDERTLRGFEIKRHAIDNFTHSLNAATQLFMCTNNVDKYVHQVYMAVEFNFRWERVEHVWAPTLALAVAVKPALENHFFLDEEKEKKKRMRKEEPPTHASTNGGPTVECCE